MPKRNSPRAKNTWRNRRVSIRSELRRQPDLSKLAGAVIALAMAQAEKEAAEQSSARKEPTPDD